MARHIWLAEVAILAEARRADRVRRAAVKAAAERDDVLASRGHARHAHRILVRLRARVAEESFCQSVRRHRNQFLSRPRASFRINKIRIEEQLVGLFLDRFHHVRVTMTCARYSVATIEIEITLAVARKNPDTFAALRDDRHLFVSRELILLFEFRDLAISS